MLVRTKSARSKLARTELLALLMTGLFAAAASAQAPMPAFTPVTDAILANPVDADWLHLNRTYDQHRYSPLKQVNKSNVAQLRMAWARGLPPGTQESTPIIYNGVMYVFTPGSGMQALDATNGDLIWQYDRDFPREVKPMLARSKSLAIYDDLIVMGAADGFLVAVDARTGKERWATKVDDGQITAGGLLVADGKIISNRTCDQGKREFCFIAAHDAKTGKELWKFFVTAAPGEPGGDTWGDMPVEQRAAGPWGLPGSYDPAKKMLYWSTANPNPYTRLKRHGRYDAVPLKAPSELYSNSTVALSVETGKLQWYYQELPGDDWDADHNHERMLIRTKVAPDAKHVRWINPAIQPGAEQNIIFTVSEGGGMFAIAQDNGEFLWSRAFPYEDPNNNMNFIDVKTGQTGVNEDKIFKNDGDKKIGCYHNTRGLWQISYHPGTNSVFVPFHDQCLSMEARNSTKSGFGPRAGILRPGGDIEKYMGVAKINVATGETTVIYSQPQPTNGSALTTAGDLMFFGDLNRRLRALDVADGKVLWEAIVGGMIMTSTITYEAKGKQYLMVFTGEGQSVTAGPLAVAKKSMPSPVRGHSAIYTFALP